MAPHMNENQEDSHIQNVQTPKEETQSAVRLPAADQNKGSLARLHVSNCQSILGILGKNSVHLGNFPFI